MPKKKALQVEIEEPFDVKAEVEEDVGEDLRVALESISAKEGILGYILRGATSASVNIKDSSKLIDYAVLSAATFEYSESLSHPLRLGKILNVVVEGKDVKILCLTKDDYRLSVFMKKNKDHAPIYKKLT